MRCCSCCKIEKPFSEFYRMKDSFQAYCKKCSRGVYEKYKSEKSWRVIFMFHEIRRGARKRGLPFILLKSDIMSKLDAQNWMCARTGIKFDLTSGSGKQPFGPSVDRIDGSLGYEPGNIQLVCNLYNYAKNEFADADVLIFAKALAKHSTKTITNVTLRVA